MQLTTPLLTSLLVGLSLLTPAFAAPPNSSEEHKFIKRSHRSHHAAPPSSGGGGMFGSTGGSMLRTVAGGTALAGGAAFAGTAGSIAAHHLFDGRDRDDSPRPQQGDGERAGMQQKVPMVQQLGAEGVNAPKGKGGLAYPVAVLMSDGSFRAVPNGNGEGQQMVQPPFVQTAPVSAGQADGDQGQAGAGGGATGAAGSGAPFVFPDGS